MHAQTGKHRTVEHQTKLQSLHNIHQGSAHCPQNTSCFSSGHRVILVLRYSHSPCWRPAPKTDQSVPFQRRNKQPPDKMPCTPTPPKGREPCASTGEAAHKRGPKPPHSIHFRTGPAGAIDHDRSKRPTNAPLHRATPAPARPPGPPGPPSPSPTCPPPYSPPADSTPRAQNTGADARRTV